MTTYCATIRHHSIASAREISVDGTLLQAKAAADSEFSEEQRDYQIVIAEMVPGRAPEIVAKRLVSGGAWIDLV